MRNLIPAYHLITFHLPHSFFIVIKSLFQGKTGAAVRDGNLSTVHDAIPHVKMLSLVHSLGIPEHPSLNPC